MSPPLDHDELMRRISRDLADGYDEELEMEIEDRHPLPGSSTPGDTEAEKDYRRDYFSQLYRLQAELVKLQDWVVASGREGFDPLRRAGCCRQGRRHQAHQPEAQSPRLPRGGAARTERPGKNPVVFPALRIASARGR